MPKDKPVKSICNFISYIEKKDEYIASCTVSSGTTAVTETASGPSLKAARDAARSLAKEVLHSKELRNLKGDFWTEDSRVFSSASNADASLNRSTGQYGISETYRQATSQTEPGIARRNGGGKNPITEKQINFIRKLASECGCSADETVAELCSKSLTDLCGQEANVVINHLKSLPKRR